MKKEMKKENEGLIDKVERDCKVRLSDMEKMYCLIAFRYGILEGIKRCEILNWTTIKEL